MTQIDSLAETQRRLDIATVNIIGSQMDTLKKEDSQLLSDAQLVDILSYSFDEENSPLRVRLLRLGILVGGNGREVIDEIGSRYFGQSDVMVKSDSSGRVIEVEDPESMADLLGKTVGMVRSLREAHHRTGWAFYRG